MTLPTDDQFPIGRRIRAAMVLAGIVSFEEMAELIAQANITSGLGPRTLRKIANDNGDHDRNAEHTDLVAIATATSVPLAFFELAAPDLRAALGQGENRGVEERLVALEHKVSLLLGEDGNPADRESLERELRDAADEADRRGGDSARVARARKATDR